MSRHTIEIYMDAKCCVCDIIDLMHILPFDADVQITYSFPNACSVFYVDHPAFPEISDNQPATRAQIVRENEHDGEWTFSRIKWLLVPGMPKLIRSDPC